MPILEQTSEELTIGFADIVASSRLFSLGGELKAKKAIGDYLSRARYLCENHEGSLIKTTGDGFIATFREPAKAVQLAVEFKNSLGVFPIEVSDHALTTRIGIHTAEVHKVKTEYGDELYGAGVNVAARIESLARPDEILVSQTTYDLLDKETSRIFHSSREIGLKQGSTFGVWSSSFPEVLAPTVWIGDLSLGDPSAIETFWPLVERELRRLAHAYMRREDPNHTLQTTALINETYLRMIDRKVQWQNRAHFFGIAAQIMRRILLDYARDQSRLKQGGPALTVEVANAEIMSAGKDSELIALDEALQRLEALDPRKSKVVELRFFGGLTVEEVAEVLKVSTVTVMRDWSFAKAWLNRELQNG